MKEFIFNVSSVVMGIIVYKYVEGLYEELRWRIKQRHEASKDPWETW